jgi:hypothetical protein
MPTVSQALKSSTEDDGPPFDADIERAIQNQSAAFDQYVSAWFYSRVRFNETASSRERWKHYLGLDHSSDGLDGVGRGLYSGFISEHGEVLGSLYCDDVVAAVALTRKKDGFLGRLGWTHSELHQVVNVPDGSGSNRLTAFVLELVDACDDIARDATDYLPIRMQRHVMDDVCGLSEDALTLLNQAALEVKEDVMPGVDPAEDEFCANASSRRDRIRKWVDLEARNSAQFFYLRGGALGCLVAGVCAWVASRSFPGPISKRQAAWAIIAGAVGAFVSVLTRMKKASGLKLDYHVRPRRLYLNGGVRALLGSIAGLVFVFSATSGVIPLAAPDGSAKLDAIFVLFSFVMGFNERLLEDMIANVREGLPGSTNRTGKSS